MTLSDLLYLCAFLAVVVGVALFVGAFLGIMSAVGAALLVLAGVLIVCARAFGASDGDTS